MQTCLSHQRMSVVCAVFSDFGLFDNSPTQGGEFIPGRALMNRHQFGAHQQAFPSHGEQTREIGLRAVAAAIRYQGDANNVERSLSREPPAPTGAETQSGDREP
jgi:hypothetical protein